MKTGIPVMGEVSAMDNKPEKTFRAGAVQATVWNNQGTGKDGQSRVFPSVTFDKRYKDKAGAWKSTASLGVGDLPKAVMVLGKAYEFLTMGKKEEASASSLYSKEVNK